jgi:hypothetical protein
LARDRWSWPLWGGFLWGGLRVRSGVVHCRARMGSPAP